MQELYNEIQRDKGGQTPGGPPQPRAKGEVVAVR